MQQARGGRYNKNQTGRRSPDSEFACMAMKQKSTSVIPAPLRIAVGILVLLMVLVLVCWFFGPWSEYTEECLYCGRLRTVTVRLDWFRWIGPIREDDSSRWADSALGKHDHDWIKTAPENNRNYWFGDCEHGSGGLLMIRLIHHLRKVCGESIAQSVLKDYYKLLPTVRDSSELYLTLKTFRDFEVVYRWQPSTKGCDCSEFKSKVVELAREKGYSAVTETYEVSEDLVRFWGLKDEESRQAAGQER